MYTESGEVLRPPFVETAICGIEMKVARFLGNARFISADATSTLPQLNRDELILGKLLGSGGFSQAFVLNGICPSSEKNRDQDDESSQTSDFSMEQEGARDDLIEKSRRKYKGESQYVVKHIQTKFIDYPRKFRDAGVDLIIEAHFLASLNHPNILSIRGCAIGTSSAYSTGRHDGFFIILDRLQETLDKRIKRWQQQLKRYKEPALQKLCQHGEMRALLFAGRLKVALDIASALSYLHDKRLVYRDLKPANVGFDKEGQTKLFDFGLAREMPAGAIDLNDVYHMSGKVGTRRYMANEVCEGRPYNQRVDVYSLSMVLWEMLSLEKPFKPYSKTMHYSRVVEKGERPRIDSSWPSGIQSLLCCGWSPQVSIRPTMKDFHMALVEEIGKLSQPLDYDDNDYGKKQPAPCSWRDALPSADDDKKLRSRSNSLRSVDTAETFVSSYMSC